MANVVIISGSPAKSSRSAKIVEYADSILSQQGIKIERIDVRDLPAEDLVYARFDSPKIQELNGILEQADAVIVVTPVYKASYTGVIKSYLDLLPQTILSNKVVLPIAIGGTIAHLLVIDYALKPVLSTLGARNILGGVYVLDSQVKWEQGSVVLDEEIRHRLDGALQEFSQTLTTGNRLRFTKEGV